MLLSSVPHGSFIVYSGPQAGKRFRTLFNSLKPYKVLLIDHFLSSLPDAEPAEVRKMCLEAIDDAGRIGIDVTLIEGNFHEIWTTLSDVSFLLLDGPDTTFNFQPFASNFIYLMHDIFHRFKDLDEAGYLDFLCLEGDAEIFLETNFLEFVPKRMWHRFYQNRRYSVYVEFGHHGWLIGKKED